MRTHISLLSVLVTAMVFAGCSGSGANNPADEKVNLTQDLSAARYTLDTNSWKKDDLALEANVEAAKKLNDLGGEYAIKVAGQNGSWIHTKDEATHSVAFADQNGTWTFGDKVVDKDNNAAANHELSFFLRSEARKVTLNKTDNGFSMTMEMKDKDDKMVSVIVPFNKVN